MNSSKQSPSRIWKKTCKIWNSELHSNSKSTLIPVTDMSVTEFSTNYHSSSLVLFAWNRAWNKVKDQIRYCTTIPYFHTTQLQCTYAKTYTNANFLSINLPMELGPVFWDCSGLLLLFKMMPCKSTITSESCSHHKGPVSCRKTKMMGQINKRSSLIR